MKMIPVPEDQRANTARWFAEHELEQKLASVPMDDMEGIDFSGHFESVQGAAWRPPADFTRDPWPAPGQIRLLSSSLATEQDQPLYVAILSEWDNGLVLAAPFSPYLSPATRGELLTGRPEPALAVLCPWCAITVSPFLFARSWYVDEMGASLKSDAWKIFRHAVTGAPVPETLQNRVGAPIVHPLDPRIRFQRRLSARMAPMLDMTARLFDELPQADGAILCQAAETLPMAAGEPGSGTVALFIQPREHRDGEIIIPAGHATFIVDFHPLSRDVHEAEGRLTLDPSPDLPPELRPMHGDLALLVKRMNDGSQETLATGGVMEVPSTAAEHVARLQGAWEALDKPISGRDVYLVICKP